MRVLGMAGSSARDLATTSCYGRQLHSCRPMQSSCSDTDRKEHR